jgi:hypothetical protein
MIGTPEVKETQIRKQRSSNAAPCSTIHLIERLKPATTARLEKIAALYGYPD